MYYAFENSNSRNLGGAEVQSYFLARELARRDFDVSVILKENAKPLENIKVFLIKKRKILNFISLYKAMKKADADAYYQRTGGFITGVISLFCVLRRKKFVFQISSIRQCRKDWPKEKNFFTRIFYGWGLRKASRIIVQTNDQQVALKENFGLESVIIKNMVSDLPPETKKENMVLWVGTVNDRKRPDMFLKLAESLPEYKFIMIGGEGANNKEFYQRMEREALKIKNLRFLGFVPYKETQKYFRKCKVFVNTSMDEGFPNTYLQAWSNYAPVAALEFDPDEVICKNKLGFHSISFDKLLGDVRLLMENEKLRRSMALNGRRYVEKNHKMEKIVNDYIQAFRGIVK